MIAKAVKGKGFRGALKYDMEKTQGRVIDSNMAGATPRELAAEFGEIRKLRPNLGKAVLHVSLSAAPGEKLSDDQWREIGKRYMDGMGLDKNQFVTTRHTDTEHEHIHIVANRIQFDGKVTSDSHDYKRQEVIMREIERDYRLERVAPSSEAERKAPTKGEIEGCLRMDEPSMRQQLQQLVDASAKNCRSFTEYQERLEAAGVELVPVAQLAGAKLSGLSYRLNGTTMKGSDLGKAYSPLGLSKRGVTYEKDRDYPAVRRSNERDAARAFGEPNRGSEASQTPERGRVGQDVGTPSASTRGTDGRDAPNAGRDRSTEPGAGREIHPSNSRGNENLQGRSHGRAESSQPTGSSREAIGVESLRPSHSNGGIFSTARERILALGGAANRAEHARPESGSRAPETCRDRSLEAIQKQVTALGVERFEVGIREAKTGKMMNREWSRDEVKQASAWLKRMNAKGNDIYIRPAGDHALVLVDDLKPEALARMKREGFAPAATIETSPGNYQVWVILTNQSLSADVRRIAAQSLAKHYGGDMNSADSRHYGRLAGFTNQKPQHTRDGQQPYVLAHDCPGKAATGALELLKRIDEGMEKDKAEKERQRRLEAIQTAQTPAYGSSDPVREYQRQAQRLLTRYGANADISKIDWMIAVDMAKSGRFAAQDIEKGIREASPNVESRKAGHIEDYAKRTAGKAWQAPEVQTRRQEQEREQQAQRSQDRGMSR